MIARILSKNVEISDNFTFGDIDTICKKRIVEIFQQKVEELEKILCEDDKCYKSSLKEALKYAVNVAKLKAYIIENSDGKEYVFNGYSIKEIQCAFSEIWVSCLLTARRDAKTYAIRLDENVRDVNAFWNYIRLKAKVYNLHTSVKTVFSIEDLPEKSILCTDKKAFEEIILYGKIPTRLFCAK